MDLIDSSETTTLQMNLDELSNATDDVFVVDEPRRINLTFPEGTVPLLIVRRKDAERLVILNNGAMDLDRSKGRPVFQRSSWWHEIGAHQLYVCDPGTVGSGALMLNWMQSSPPSWLIHKLAKAIRVISRILGVDNGVHRTYFGSSAGGFSALSCLAYDPKANAIINNAQFDWTRWYAPQVRKVLEARFPGHTAADIRTKWPHRANALESLIRRKSSQTVDYWINLASDYDRTVQMPFWNKMLENHPVVAANFTMHCYYDEASGHNPLTRQQTLEILNNI